MKFNILKLSFSIAITSLIINITHSTQTQTQSQSTSTLQTEAKTIAGFKANYKITLGSLVSKSNKKKYEAKLNSQARTNNGYSELNRLSQNEPKQMAGNQIFFRGWLKYFKFADSNNSKKPKQFFRNVMFEKEARRNNADENNVYFFWFYKFFFEIEINFSFLYIKGNGILLEIMNIYFFYYLQIMII